MPSPNLTRKFKVEPIDTATRHSKGQHPNLEGTDILDPETSSSHAAPRPRRFIPEIVEHTQRSSREPRKDKSCESSPRRFSPQLIETSSRYRGSNASSTGTPPASRTPTQTSQSNDSLKAAPRTFTPQLLETASRSRKEGDAIPNWLTSGQVEVEPVDSHHQPSPTHPKAFSIPLGLSSPESTPTIPSHEARRLGIPIPKRRSSKSIVRSRSYRATGLETIESSESEEESFAPSPSSPYSPSDLSYCHSTRARESVDDSTSGYLLGLAAKTAERQLQEQGLAAFPNDDRHQPIRHYVDIASANISRSNSGNDLDLERSDSIDFKVKELGKRRDKSSIPPGQERTRGIRSRAKRSMDRNLRANPALRLRHDPHGRLGSAASKQRDGKFENMRKQARPPMLGSDIKFPRSDSPEPARFDVTQGSERLRQAMCYLTEQSESSEKPGGLWCPQKTQTGQSSIWSRPSSGAPSHGGLWGGSCLETGSTVPKAPTGILTPKFEDDMPMESVVHSSSMLRQLPPSPPPSNSGMASLDEKLEVEEHIEDEFDDGFVTQVYNYLSLGYPSLARNFDSELSKISRIQVSELRQDDHLPNSRGYIRLGDDETNEGIEEESCARWRALRLYIQEWARQQPKMAPSPFQGGGMVAARKGSWAW